jgi:hypothetical protein
MKNSILVALGLFVAASLLAVKPCSAAFVVGGENGWQLSTDGIVDVFATYNTTSPMPTGNRSLSLLSVGAEQKAYEQRFGVGIGLLPSVVAFNIKAPTTNGVDSTVRIGIYPAIQNNYNNNGSANRFDTSPNIDFREFFYTAKGAYGELLAGRALNLYQGKNILTDMTLLTAGVVPGPAFRGNTTLGHIGYGYLYANFGPQIRYTTPDFAGVKVAVSVGEPYAISQDTGKTNTPRWEAEISYAKTFGVTSLQAWGSGLYQTAVRRELAAARPGKDNQSIGGAAGVSVGVSGFNFLVSGYGGRGLGMVSAQDGDFLGSTSVDGAGNERTQFGYLVQATFKVTPSIMLGVNYGQSQLETSNFDNITRTLTPGTYSHLIKCQEAAVGTVTYNLNKFTQFIAEYSYAQNTWEDGAKQHSNQVALGTMFYW